MNATLPPPDTSGPVPPTPATRPQSVRPRLVRPRSGRRIGGVCAAIADRYDWSRTTVRLVAVLSVLVPGPQVLAYVVAWIVIPAEDETAASPAQPTA